MDKKNSHKGENNISSTLLTPCRPVGLRRKRSDIKNTNSPTLKLSSSRDITSPSTPLNTSSFKAQIITDQISPAENVQQHFGTSSVISDIINIEDKERKSIKRKSTASFGSSILRRKLLPTTTDDATATFNNGTKNETLLDGDRKSSVTTNEENNESPKVALRDCDTEKSRDADVSHSCSTNVSSCNDTEESVDKRVITATEIGALRERIAIKEKKIKELQLAALYKKKHDHKQVAKEIDSWLRGCKDALNDLQTEIEKRGQCYSLTQLLKTLGIPPSLIDIDEDDSDN